MDKHLYYRPAVLGIFFNARFCDTARLWPAPAPAPAIAMPNLEGFHTDPYSVITATVGLLDICWRLGVFLKETYVGAATVENEISALSQEIKLLIDVNISLQNTCKSQQDKVSDTSVVDSKLVSNLLKDAVETLAGCQEAVEKLEKLLHTIIGKSDAKSRGKGRELTERILKQFRKDSKAVEFNQCRSQISNYQNSLQLLLTAINLSYTRASYDSTGHLSESVQLLGFKLQSQLASLRSQLELPANTNVHNSINSATEIASLLPLNKFFDPPKVVSEKFTGREHLLDQLEKALFSQETKHVQRRFVVYGLGGSGKTEFCCKFAQNHQQSFWGVFWVDATSLDTILDTYSKIAKFGGLEPNVRSAQSWLSSLDQPWLLIIDNADDPDIPLEDCFPKGERGCILVTTRNQYNRGHGTVGSRFFHFEQMEREEANELLLKHAEEPFPWTAAVYKAATAIAEALGYLPLALVHAGKAIMANLCTLSNYLDYFHRSWHELRRARRARSLVQFQEEDEDSDMNVYSSYEIIFLGLEAKKPQRYKDAIEILQTFSFLNWDNIQFDMLIAAVENPRKEQQAQEQEAKAESLVERVGKPLTWSQLFKNVGLYFNGIVLGDRTPPVLPNILRDFHVDRLNRALLVLSQMSLVTITKHGSSIRYSMHPLIHKWVRERPRISTGQQAIWCRVASTILAQCVLLPPLGTTEADVQLQKTLLPHVIHVRRCQEEIDAQIAENRSLGRRSWLPGPGRTLARQRLEASQFARFSIVYSRCGIWDVAETLQRQVMDFVCSIFGTEHPSSVAIMLALSFTYTQQTRANEAAELQKKALVACRNLFGPENQKTLKVMDMLATSCTRGGRLQQALELYETVIDKMTVTLGPDHEETLLTIDNLGRLMMLYMRHEDARTLHEKALTGLTNALGSAHLQTLIAMESLAMANLELGGDLLPPAYDMMIKVVEERKRMLGTENPYTLLAICNLGRIKSAMGDTIEAEALIRTGLPIAERNLGKDHFGVLMAEAQLAKVLERQKRYKEAEVLLVNVVRPERYGKSARDDGEHPDRIAHLHLLVQCYATQEKYDDALRVNEELLLAIKSCGGQGLGENHILYKKVTEKMFELRRLRAAILEPASRVVDSDYA